MTNTRRYISLFAEAADELMPQSSAHGTEDDVFDVLMRQVPFDPAPFKPPRWLNLDIIIPSVFRGNKRKLRTSRTVKCERIQLSSSRPRSAAATACTLSRSASRTW